VSSQSKAEIADALCEARERTLALVEPLDDEQLNAVYSPLLSPLAWDLGHIANFEELWLVQTIAGREPLHGELGRFYDAIENPRRIRGELPILRDAELRSYMADVRERTLDVLEGVDIGPDVEDPLLREGFVYEMLLAHELQHNETMLQLLQLVDGYQLPAGIESGRISPRIPGTTASGEAEMVAIEAGEYEVGASAAVSPTTTSALATASSWPPSRSTEPRSPAARTSPSWRTPEPSPLRTGSATEPAGSIPPGAAVHRSSPASR